MQLIDIAGFCQVLLSLFFKILPIPPFFSQPIGSADGTVQQGDGPRHSSGVASPIDDRAAALYLF
jgi:hypothetical protein